MYTVRCQVSFGCLGQPNVAISSGVENVQRGSASKEHFLKTERILRQEWEGEYWKSAYFFCDFSELKTVSYCTPYASCIGKTSNHHKTHTCFWQRVEFLLLFFFISLSVFKSTIIYSAGLSIFVTSTGQNASLIHCARLKVFTTHPHLKVCKTNPLVNKTKRRTIKIQKWLPSDTRIRNGWRSLLDAAPLFLKSFKTCSSG